MTSTGPIPPSTQARTLRALAFAFGSAPVLVVAVVAFVLPTSWDDEPPVALVIALIALVGVGLLVAESVGFHAPALGASTASSPDQSAEVSLSHFQTMMLLRFSLTEMPILLGLVVSFVLDYGIWPLAVTAVFGIPVMWFETWPSRRNANKLARSLESEGVRSWLPEALGVA